MNKQEFINYIKNPASLNKEDIPVLDELIEKFPFTSFPYLLKAKVLRDMDSIHFEKQLHLAAAYASDRKKLHELIHTYRTVPATTPTEIIEGNIELLNIDEPLEEVNNVFEEQEIVHETIDSIELQKDQFIEQNIEPLPVEESLEDEIDTTSEETSIIHQTPEIDPSDNLSFSEWLKRVSNKRNSKEDNSLVIELDTTEEIRPVIQDELEKLFIENVFHEGYLLEVDHNERPIVEFKLEDKKEKLIQEFIKKEPAIGKPEDTPTYPENKAKKSSDDNDIPVSETLANIFAKQKLFTKAIAAYEKLSLKFPEKKTYFADLIQKIKEENQIN